MSSRPRSLAAHRDPWPLALAFDLGRTAQQIAAVVELALPEIVRRRLLRPLPAGEVVPRREIEIVAACDPDTSGPATREDPIHALQRCSEQLVQALGHHIDGRALALGPTRVPLHWRDVVALAEASGLQRALREVGRRAHRWEAEPVLAFLAERFGRLDPYDRETLARRFFERIEADPLTRHLVSTFGAPIAPSPADVDRLMLIVASSATRTLRELGLSDDHIARLAAITDDLARPIADLVALYAAPKTARDKLRRLWRLQRVGLQAALILHRARAEPSVARSRPAV